MGGQRQRQRVKYNVVVVCLMLVSQSVSQLVGHWWISGFK